MAQGHISLNPKHAASEDDFDLDAAISMPVRETDEQLQSLTIHRCARTIRWALFFLANRHSKSMALVARIAFRQGLNVLMARDFVSSIATASNRVFEISSDPDDRGWFENGKFTLLIAGRKKIHVYPRLQDVEACGRLASILGIESYVAQQLAIASGLLFSTSLPAHCMNALGGELHRFIEWGEDRAQKADRELKRVESESASRSGESPPRMNWRYVFK